MSDVRKIKLTDIALGDRERPDDASEVKKIALSMAEQGQVQPIILRPTPNGEKPFTLVVGLHRLQAAWLLEWSEIDAISRKMTADQAKEIELDENLARHDLSALDRALFLRRKKELHERLYPETVHGGDRKSSLYQERGDRLADQDAKFGILKFTDAEAERTGLSVRSIARQVKLANDLDPDAVTMLRGTDAARNASQLSKIAALPVEQQRQVAETAYTTKAKVSDVVAGLSPRAVPERSVEIEVKALQDLFDRSSKAARTAFIEQISGWTA